MRKKEVFNIIFSSMMIALAVCFELVAKVVPLPFWTFGGSVSISMLPLIVGTIVCGWGYGLASGCIYGLLNCFVLDGYSFNLASFILDYILAFSGVALIAIFKDKILEGKKKYFVFGVIIVYLFRYACSGFSGVINAGVWGYDEAFLEEMFGPGKGSTIYLYVYSFIVYNLPYIVASCILSIAIGLISYKRVILRNYDNYYNE